MALVLAACVPAQQYDALENDYNQLNQQSRVRSRRTTSPHYATAGSDQGGREQRPAVPLRGLAEPPAAAQTISEMAPILAPFQQTRT